MTEMRGERAHTDQHPNLGRRALFVSSALMAVLPIVLNGVSVFATGFIIHTLGAAEYGRWATASMLVGTTNAFANMGLRPLFVRDLASGRRSSRELLAEQLAVRLLLGFLAAVLSMIAALALGYPLAILTCCALFAAGLFLTTAWTVFADYLQAFERFTVYAMVSFVAGLALTVTSVITVALGGGAVGLSAAYLAGPILTTVLLARQVARLDALPWPYAEWRRMKDLLSESKTIAGAQVLSSIRDRGEQLLLPKIAGVSLFGIYAASIMPADRLNGLADALATVFYPRISAAGDADRAEYSGHLLLCLALVGAMAGAALYVTSPLLGTLLLPRDAATASQMIRTFSFGVPAAALALGLTNVLQATGHHRIGAWVTNAVSVCTIVLMVALVLRWGIWGAAAAWVLRQHVLAFCLACVYATRMPLSPFLIARTTALCGILFGVAMWATEPGGGAVRAAGGCVLLLVTFSAGTVVLGLLRPLLARDKRTLSTATA